MNRRNKIIFIIVFFFCLLALGVGIYFFPNEEPMGVDQRLATREKTGPQPAKSGSDPFLKKDPASLASPADQAKTSPPADAGASAVDPYVSYPETLLDLLEIDMADLIQNRDAFKNSIIHVEWMDRVNDILKDLDPEKRAAIIKNQTSLLYIKEKLNEAYLSGKIDHETFKKSLADLMKWHQRTYESILTQAEYEALFEISPEQVDDTIDALIDQTPEYSFILNQDMPVEAVTQQVQGYKLEEVNSHFKRMVLDRDNIGKQINSGAMTLEQARAALHQSEQAFIAKCKEILTEDEINTIFGSLAALETGATQTEAPAVEGDADIVELGFQIENPNTSIDKVKDTLDPTKIEDIRFFYQERAAERDKLIDKLDAGEIASEEVEAISNEMDAAFDENCRSTLTDAEYQLIFGNPGDSEQVLPDNPETLPQETEPETPKE